MITDSNNDAFVERESRYTVACQQEKVPNEVPDGESESGASDSLREEVEELLTTSDGDVAEMSDVETPSLSRRLRDQC